MAEITVKVLSKEEQLQAENAKLRMEFYQMKNIADGTHQEPSSLQSKIARQKVALRNLNKRTRVQRLILRELNEHNAELADTLYRTVMDKYASELNDDITLFL